MSSKTIIIPILALLLLSGCSLNWPRTADGPDQNKNGQEASQTVAGDDRDNSSFYISLRSPQAGQVLKSPFLVGGQAILPSDLVYVRVKNSRGDVLIKEATKIKNETADSAGDPFSILINFHFQSTDEGVVEIYGQDQDGKEISATSVPVRFDADGSSSNQDMP